MKVIKNYVYNAGYQILLMLAPMITVPYIARVLGAHLSGINSYTNSWVTFFYMLGQLGITLYGNREIAYHRSNVFERSKAFWEIETLQIITSACSFAIYITAVLLFSTTFKFYFLLQSVWIIATGLDISWYFMGMEDFKKTVSRNTVVKLISIGLIFLLVRNHHDLWKYILLLGVAQLSGSLTLWPYLRGSVQWVKIRLWRPFKHFYPTLLLFIPTITTQVYLVVNRLMLGRMASQTALGEFDYADKIVKLVLAIVTATGTVMLPNVANKFASGDVQGVRQSLYNSFDFVNALAIPMMFGMMAISAKFAPWFLGNQFMNTGKIIFLESPVIVFIAWSNVTGTQYLMPVNRLKEFTASVTIGAVFNVIANLFLIKLYGANGAAIATSLSELLIATVQLQMIRTTIKRRKMFVGLWKYLLSGLLMFIVVFRLSQIMKMTFVNLMLQVLLGALLYVACLLVVKAPIIGQVKKILNERF